MLSERPGNIASPERTAGPDKPGAEDVDPTTSGGRDSGGRRWGEIGEQRNLAITVVTGFFFGAIALTRLVGVVEAGSLTLGTIASIVLLAFTFILLLIWGWTTQRDLGMFEQVIGRHIPPVPGSSFPLVVAAAVMLGALGVATAWPFVFALVYFGLRAVEARGYVLIQQMVRDGIGAARAEPMDRDHSKALDAVERYYLRRPCRRLQTGQLALAAGAAVLAAIAFEVTDAFLKEAVTSAAYALLIVTILVNETVMHAWRRDRGRELPTLYR